LRRAGSGDETEEDDESSAVSKKKKKQKQQHYCVVAVPDDLKHGDTFRAKVGEKTLSLIIPKNAGAIGPGRVIKVKM
jgi:hypothetical protein